MEGEFGLRVVEVLNRGGELRVDSTLGIGTTVAVQLPMRPLATLPAAKSVQSAPAALVA